MKHSFNEDRSRLIIEVDSEERKQLAEMEDLQSDNAMHEFLEPLTCNSELDWVRPEETGDLTDAPLLGIRSENMMIAERWGYEPYQLRSPLVDLRDNGRVVFCNSW